jgi:hypothetical protein
LLNQLIRQRQQWRCTRIQVHTFSFKNMPYFIVLSCVPLIMDVHKYTFVCAINRLYYLCKHGGRERTSMQYSMYNAVAIIYLKLALSHNQLHQNTHSFSLEEIKSFCIAKKSSICRGDEELYNRSRTPRTYWITYDCWSMWKEGVAKRKNQ